MKVLVTGSNGMLGSEVMKILGRCEISSVPTTIDDMDLTSLASVRDVLHRECPTHIIHTAAFTMVDTAEKDPLTAFQINAEGTKNLAFFSRELDIELIYLSTDYVFSGAKKSPYLESDEPGPINVYGKSKLLGEEYVRTLLEKYKIVRTSWLNGLGGDHSRNFIETMLRVAKTRSTLSLVTDQVSRPTFTFDLAQALITLLSVNSHGIFHVTNQGECSWFEFAREIFSEAGVENIELKPILSEQFRSAAQRPAYSAMDNTRFGPLGMALLPDWKESLREYFRRRRLFDSLSVPEESAPSPHAIRV